MRHVLVLLLLSMFASAAEPAKCPTPSILSVDKGEYTQRPGVVFVLENYLARMVPRSKHMPQCMQKDNEVQHGRIVVSGSSLTTMFNQKLRQGGKSKITDLKVELKGSDVAISGKMHKVLAVPFSVEGPVDSPDGKRLRLHADKVKAAGIPVKGLMDALGVELAGLISPGQAKGVSANGDDLYFDVDKLGHTRGHISKVQIAGENLMVEFSPGETKQVAQNHRAASAGKGK